MKSLRAEVWDGDARVLTREDVGEDVGEGVGEVLPTVRAGRV